MFGSDKDQRIVQRCRFTFTNAIESARACAVTINPEGCWPLAELFQFAPWKLSYPHPQAFWIDLVVFRLMVTGNCFEQWHVDDVQKLRACVVLIATFRRPHLRRRPRAHGSKPTVIFPTSENFPTR